MSAWTPGPWEYSASDVERHAVVSPPVDAEGDIGPWFTAIFSCADDAVETANARLAAAAPDLYAALETAASRFRDYEQIHRLKGTEEGYLKADNNGDLAVFCEATLARARGEQSL